MIIVMLQGPILYAVNEKFPVIWETLFVGRKSTNNDNNRASQCDSDGAVNWADFVCICRLEIATENEDNIFDLTRENIIFMKIFHSYGICYDCVQEYQMWKGERRKKNTIKL